MSPAIDRAFALPAGLQHWLATHAEALDRGDPVAAEVLPQLAHAGLLSVGLEGGPQHRGGSGGQGACAAVSAIAAVARESVTAAFVYWGQRSFIEYLVAGDAPALRAQWLDDLVHGRLAGATGLPNVTKFLAHIEPLQVQAAPDGDGWRLQGTLPWVTHLHPQGFAVAAAAQPTGGGAPVVLALHSSWPGLHRSPDLDLIGLRGSFTAAIGLDGVQVPAGAVLSADGPAYLARVRPAFLAMQCGLSIGLAQAALAAAQAQGGGRAVLAPRLAAADAALQEVLQALAQGLADDRFVARPAGLFALRLRLAALVQEALQLELQATGGRAYVHGAAPGFARRWRESAFIPVITPSVTQLQTALQAQAPSAGAPA